MTRRKPTDSPCLLLHPLSTSPPTPTPLKMVDELEKYTYKIQEATSPEDVSKCIGLRVRVFQEEMGAPPESPERAELTRTQDAASVHFLALEITPAGLQIPIGSCRLVLPSHKLGRLIVVSRCRSLGIGVKLVAAASDWAVVAAKKKGESEGFLFCHAMAYVSGFYEKLGWKSEGPPIREPPITGSWHQKMVKRIDT